MQFLCIGIDGCTEDSMQGILDSLEQLKSYKIDYSIKEDSSNGSASIICRIGDDNLYKQNSAQSYKMLKTLVANVLADYIIRQYEQKLITRIINNNYCYFSSLEKKEILKKTLHITRNEDRNFFNSLFQIRRRNTIVRKLIDYFDSSNSLILDGFVNFRLKDYVKDLEEVVDKAVDDYLMEREYKEFIRLLRYFVDIQEPKFETIHVIASMDNKYILLDERKREITSECIQEFINEISEDDINYDDLLVSSLITFAPKKITIHCTGQLRNKELLETIKNVFPDKVFMCNGCEICLLSVARNETKK